MSFARAVNASLFLSAALALACLFSSAAPAATAGWPDTIDLLIHEQSQARSCLDLLKGSGDKSAIARARVAYGEAKAGSDGAIAGFSVALVEGYKPEDLPRIQTHLEKAGAGLQEVCNAAIKAATEAPGTKGVVDETVKEAVAPVIDLLKSAAGALWQRHVQLVKAEQDEIRGQLEAARWPDF
jgi:hypothetical protein